jgi:CRISPR/Cas system CSM-associated protein Csm4 (group 5 of RAMP superfamily)
MLRGKIQNVETDSDTCKKIQVKKVHYCPLLILSDFFRNYTQTHNFMKWIPDRETMNVYAIISWKIGIELFFSHNVYNFDKRQ